MYRLQMTMFDPWFAQSTTTAGGKAGDDSEGSRVSIDQRTAAESQAKTSGGVPLTRTSLAVPFHELS